jgi:16S rRNA C967 or C1407 C5-methylase (RsmB/RsmF family)
MAYSSCAINPVENEAVMARLIRQSEGALELVDCRGKLSGIRNDHSCKACGLYQGIIKGDGSITVPLISCLTGLD